MCSPQRTGAVDRSGFDSGGTSGFGGSGRGQGPDVEGTPQGIGDEYSRRTETALTHLRADKDMSTEQKCGRGVLSRCDDQGTIGMSWDGQEEDRFGR